MKIAIAIFGYTLSGGQPAEYSNTSVIIFQTLAAAQELTKHYGGIALEVEASQLKGLLDNHDDVHMLSSDRIRETIGRPMKHMHVFPAVYLREKEMFPDAKWAHQVFREAGREWDVPGSPEYDAVANPAVVELKLDF